MGRLAPSTKPLHKIAIFGAGGTNIGHHVLEALVKEPDFAITVLPRESSKSTFPPNVAVTRVADGFPHAALVEALQGQDVLISAVGPEAKHAEHKLVEAAIEAGVRRFFPTEYGLDNSDPKKRGGVADLWDQARHAAAFEVQAEGRLDVDVSWDGHVA